MPDEPRKIFDLMDTETEPTDEQLAELMHYVGEDIRAETAELKSKRHGAKSEAVRGLFSMAIISGERRRHFILYFDGLRYSFKMLKLVSARMTATLSEVVKCREKGQSTEEPITSALLDAWTIVDMTHRIRELLQQMPGLSLKRPEVQIYLRATSRAEELRHHVQHFRSGIPSLPSDSAPLWGSLSWVLPSDPTTCYTLLTGNFLDGTASHNITYDLHRGMYVCSVYLHAGALTVSLMELSDAGNALRQAILDGLRECGVVITEADSPIFGMSIRSTPQDETVSSGNP